MSSQLVSALPVLGSWLGAPPANASAPSANAATSAPRESHRNRAMGRSSPVFLGGSSTSHPLWGTLGGRARISLGGRACHAAPDRDALPRGSRAALGQARP